MARAASGALAAAAIAAGCGGGGQPAFDAEIFISSVNARGAALVLGDRLESSREGFELYEVGAGGAGEAAPAESGSGTLVVAPSDDEALAEYERCELAGELVCFRAANVAIYFGSELEPGEAERLGSALEAVSAAASG